MADLPERFQGPAEQYIRREMARKARRAAREFEDIAEQIRDAAKILDQDDAPDVYAVVDALLKAVAQDPAQAAAELRGLIRELAAWETVRGVDHG